MRIIKQGSLKPKPEQMSKCPKCDTIFAYTSDDVTANWAGGDQDSVITCPFCRKTQAVGDLKPA